MKIEDMMKNYFILVCILILLINFGCGDKKENTNITEGGSGLTVKNENVTPEKNISIEKKMESKERNIVTFIELGSVKCIPCRMMQPIIREIEEEYKDKVKVVFYDVWTEEGAIYAEKYRIRVIPTQIFLDKDGNEYFRHEGFFPKEEIIKVLKEKGVR